MAELAHIQHAQLVLGHGDAARSDERRLERESNARIQPSGLAVVRGIELPMRDEDICALSSGPTDRRTSLSAPPSLLTTMPLENFTDSP